MNMRSLVIAAFLALTLAAISTSFAQMGDNSMMTGSDDFDSGVLHNGDSFQHVFNATGTFGYHCHIHMSMTGSVTVVDSADAAMTANVTIQNFAFSPRNVTIAKGGTVTWTNLDNAGHQVMSDSMTQHGGGMMMGHHAPMASGLAEDNTFEKLSPDKAQKGLDRANASKLFAKLTLNGGVATGRFVSFNWSDATGTMTDLRLNEIGETVFSSVAIQGWMKGDEGAEAHGAVFHAYGMDPFVSVHNDPTVGLHVQTDENATNVTFTLASGMRIASLTAKTFVIADANGTHHGHLILLGNATATNTTGAITVSLGADDGVLFLAHPGKDAAATNDLHAIVAAASGGHLGTVLGVADAGDGTPVEDELPLAAHAATKTLSSGHVVVTVSSDTSAGKTIVIRFTTDTIHAGPVNVTVGGETFAATNVTGQDATAAIASLQSAGKGATVSFADDGAEIVVQIPHFSDQTVTIDQTGASGGGTTGGETSTTSTPGKGAPGFEAAALLAALAGVALLAMRRRS